MKITCFAGGMAQTNGYLLEMPDGNVLVDAPDGVADWLNERGVLVDAILLTHQHYDHVEDVAVLQRKGVKVHAHSPYSKELTLEAFAAGWGLPNVEPYQVDELLDMNGRLNVVGLDFTLFHVPGHAPDSVAFYDPAHSLVFTGDALFAGSIGRTDLPGGSMDTLVRVVREHLLSLPGETRALPGHGPATSIACEMSSNPYL